MANNVTTADFFGMHLSIIERDGKKWLTAEQVGRALGYSAGNVRQGVINLYNRRRNEFSDSDTGEIDLISPGGTQATRVFSASGCILLTFFANTLRAAKFRGWAKKHLAGQVAQPLAPAPIPVPGIARSIKITRALERIVFERFVEGERQADIARSLRISPPTVFNLLHGKCQFSPFAGEPECSPELVAAVAARIVELETQKLLEAQMRATQRLRSTANNQQLADVLDRAGQELEKACIPMLTAPPQNAP